MNVRFSGACLLMAAVGAWIWLAPEPMSADHAPGLVLAFAALVVAGVLVGGPRVLLLCVALAISFAVVWSATYDSATSDDSSWEGVMLALIVFGASAGAAGVGALIGRLLAIGGRARASTRG